MPRFGVNSGGMAIGVASFAFMLWLVFSTLSSAQAVDPKIDFTKVSIWNTLKTCVQDCFIYPNEQATGPDVQYQLGCTTDGCLCRADTLGQGLEIVSSIALEYCSDYQDVTTAASVLTAYCASAGYTSIIAPTNAAPTGPSTVTVTAYVTVHASNSIRSASPSTVDLRVTIVLALAFLIHGSFY